MQNFFVAVKHDGGTDYLKTTAIDRETLLETLPRTLNCPPSAICAVVRVFQHEFENSPASTIKTSAGLFKIVLEKLDGKYGAPMGRGNVNDCPLITDENGIEYTEPGKTFDRRIELDGQGYDKGGAYWGRGTELRVTYNQDLTYINFYRR
jgi:hypothetical protein